MGYYMKSKVRDFIRIETNDIVHFDNFAQIYYLFEQLIHYDVDAPAIEGLGERLPYVLNMIATEKMERTDIITFLPIVWGRFEAYTKKILFIIDREKYNSVINTHESLEKVLGYFGIPVKVPECRRTNRTEAIYKAYDLRNKEAHECKIWSVHKCYEILAYVLTAYLIVTEKALPELQAAMQNTITKNGVNFDLLNTTNRLKTDIFDNRYRLLESIHECCLKYRKIGAEEYDRDGWLVKSNGGSSPSHFSYERRNGTIVSRKCKETSCDLNGNEKDREYVDRKYYYDDEKSLIKVECFRIEPKSNEVELLRTINIEYCSDGSVIVTTVQRIKKMKNYFASKSNMNDESEYEIQEVGKKIYNPSGQLEKSISTIGEIRYIYSGSGSLEKIERIRKKDHLYIEFFIKNIGDNQFRIRYWQESGIELIVEKRLFQRNKLVRIKHFTNEDHDRNLLGFPKLDSETNLEYYDDEN